MHIRAGQENCFRPFPKKEKEEKSMNNRGKYCTHSKVLRVLAVVLALSMLLGMSGIQAFAEEDTVVKIAARQEELSVEEEVIMTVSDFNIQQRLIASAEEALDLAVMAYEQTRQRFIIGKADVNSLTLSLNRQQEAQKNYISALQNYWLNYYKIRKLTLHDFASGFSLSDKFDFNVGMYR